ncbi:MAG: glycosyltransferase family 4 protein [Fibrobacteria bacterium]|nr:glycosyltransferase family 4 protein [Fibrobacteria bacterium]
MRLLQVNKFATLNGGSETVAATISRGMSEQGHDVLLVGFSKANQELIPGSLSLGPELQRPWVPFCEPALVERIVSIARDFRPDAILHHNIYHHFPMAQLVESLDRRISVPQSLLVHDHKPVCAVYSGMRKGQPCHECRGDRFWKAIRHRCKDENFLWSLLLGMDSMWNAKLRGVYSRFHRVISPSRYLAALLEGIGNGRHIEWLVNPGPEVKEGAAIRDGIAFVGRFTHDKGVPLLLRMVERFPEIRFVAVGDGEMRPALEELARNSPNLELHGWESREGVSDILAGVKWTFVPSLAVENNPMVILEAFSRGTPVLGSDFGGIPELLADRKGVLFDPQDIESALKIMDQCLRESDEIRGERSRLCRQWAVEHEERFYIRRLVELVS